MTQEQKPREWTPDMPLRADATDLQISQRYVELRADHSRGHDGPAVIVAREFAAACVAAAEVEFIETVQEEIGNEKARRSPAGPSRAAVEAMQLDMLGRVFDKLTDAMLALYPAPAGPSREEVEAILLGEPHAISRRGEWCSTCKHSWPCPTQRVLALFPAPAAAEPTGGSNG